MDKVGYSIISADGVLSSSGEPVAIYGFHIISGAGGGVVNLRNGTAVSDDIVITEEGTASTGVTFDFGGIGVVFPSGCYVDIDANTTSVTMFYERIK